MSGAIEVGRGRGLILGALLGVALACPATGDVWVLEDGAGVEFGFARERRVLFGLVRSEPAPLDDFLVTTCPEPSDTLWAIRHRPDTALITQNAPWVYALMPLRVNQLRYGESLGPHYAVLRPARPLKAGTCYAVSLAADYWTAFTRFEVDANGRARTLK